jgi:hypothetical protein
MSEQSLEIKVVANDKKWQAALDVLNVLFVEDYIWVGATAFNWKKLKTFLDPWSLISDETTFSENSI